MQNPFVKRYSVSIVALVLAVLGIGYYFFFHDKEAQFSIRPIAQNNATTSPAVEVKPPTVSFEIQKGKKSNLVVIRWGNLPAGTTKLNIFISKKSSNNWSLWQTVSISSDELSGGSTSFNANSTIAGGGYSFYAEAQPGNGLGPLWTSSSTNPTSGTPPTPPTPGTPPPSTAPPPPASPPPPPPPPAPPSAPSGNPSGTTYYTPSGGISGSLVPQTANFWVQHVNNKSLEIGWQNIPADADDVIIYRSQNSGGPWVQILDQKNPASSYSIGLVDNTLYDTYYYKMDVFRGGSQIAEYGPVVLPPL